jgi:phosphoribosylaminoimidazolecarboxamide formyltransferase/IMP cyclohydrolase
VVIMSEGIVAIRRALLSVFDKRDLIGLARSLAGRGIELLASGGTRTALVEAGLSVTEVADYTGQPEVLGGRVKTLHPKIHAGILARRDVPGDLATLEQQGFPPIDLVVVNLYPFRSTIARPDVTLAEAVENIDIGGPTLIRAAAKNHEHVAVLTSPDQYDAIVAAIGERGGTSLEDRRRLALAAFELTSRYDSAIAEYLGRSFAAPEAPPASAPFPPVLECRFLLRSPLRYGENPHQRGAFYTEPAARGPNLATATVLHGKELSYNNLLDLDSALRLIRQFAEPAACILKHNNPCGAAVANDLAAAFERAYEGDPVSAFGGIVGTNRRVDRAAAERMCQPGRFLEAILAPRFDVQAMEWLTTKPTWRNSVRLIELGAPIGPEDPPPLATDLRRIEGGLLVQDWDRVEADPASGSVPTRRAPTESERRDLAFAWRVCAAVKSNAIVLAKEGQLIGVGAGQMSRLDSVRIAVEKAGPRTRGSVLASDAFFPFRDGPDLAAAAGITAIIQPGGSRRDDETIRACDEHKIAMILTGRRHFRH